MGPTNGFMPKLQTKGSWPQALGIKWAHKLLKRKLFNMMEPMAYIVLVLVHQKMLGLMAEFVLASVQNLRKMTMTNDSGK